jgi:hypothetical protein
MGKEWLVNILIEAEAVGADEPWLSVRLDQASIYGFVSGDRLGEIAKHLTEVHAKWLKARERLDDFNSERFHPTGRV